MDIQLKLPYAEIFSIDFPHKRIGWRRRKQFVKEELCELHPGFCDESLWDYKLVKQNERKIIKAVVLSRDFYLENKLSKRHVRFFIEDDEGRKITLFKKRHWKLFVLLIFIIMSAAASVYLMQTKKVTEPEESLEETVEVIEDVPSVFDYMNIYASVIRSHGGTIKLVQFNGNDGGELRFSVSGCEPYSLIKDFNDAEETKECTCGNVTYNGEKEYFEVKIRIKSFQVRQKILLELELLESQNHITEKLRESSVRLVSSGMQKESGIISFLIECDGKEVAALNEKIARICTEERVFLSDFTETKEISSGIFTVNFSVVNLDEKQKVKESAEDECLSIIFEESPVKKEELPSQTAGKRKTEKKNNGKLTKIGSVKKEGRALYYYRTEDGKIIISEEVNE